MSALILLERPWLCPTLQRHVRHCSAGCCKRTSKSSGTSSNLPLDNFGAVLCLNIELEDRINFYLIEDLVPHHNKTFGDADLTAWEIQVTTFLNRDQAEGEWVKP